MIDYGKRGDVGALDGGVETITYTVNDAVGNEIAKGTMPVNPVGGFDTKFTLPKTPNLGYANVQFIDARPDDQLLHARLPDPRVPPPRVRGVGAARARDRSWSAAVAT